MEVNDQMLAWLKDNCNKMSMNELCKIIDQYNINIETLPLSVERAQALEVRKSDIMWENVASCADAAKKVDLCHDYISKFSGVPSAQAHVAEAQQIIQQVAVDIESKDWQSVDKTSYQSLYVYRNKYPKSIHMGEIERLAWDCIGRTTIDLQRYINDFPTSFYADEARSIIESAKAWEELCRTRDINLIERFISSYPASPHISEAQTMMWQNVRASGDILKVIRYLRTYPSSPVIGEANNFLSELKSQKLADMRCNPSAYGVNMIGGMLVEGVFSEYELVSAGVASEKSLRMIRNMPELPPLPTQTSRIDNLPKGTDVFLLGIPASGKTCALMALMGSPGITYDSVIGGGEYAMALDNYRDAGLVPGSTPGNFMAAISARVKEGDVTHNVNVIEMAGEKLADEIAMNPNAVMGLEHLADGATELMRNDNRKVMFIVIDPSVTGLVPYYSKSQGTVVPINQRQIIARVIDIMRQSPNVMKKVDSIHFIMTKADILGDRTSRDTEAYRRFMELYSKELETLCGLMEEYGINANNKYRPMLYTLSLGNFYVGDIFDYDQTDANKLVEVIKNSTHGTKAKNWWVRFKEFVN